LTFGAADAWRIGPALLKFLLAKQSVMARWAGWQLAGGKPLC